VAAAAPAPHMVTLQEFSRRMVGSDTIDSEQLQQIREQKEVYDPLIEAMVFGKPALVMSVSSIILLPLALNCCVDIG